MKYVFFAPQKDSVYKKIFGDAIIDKNVLYLEVPQKKYGKICNKIIQTNKIKILWIKKIFYAVIISKYIKLIKKFVGGDDCVIIAMYSWYNYLLLGLTDWINEYKKNHNNCKSVFLFYDIIDSYKGNIDLQLIKTNFDLVISFDFEDCEEYNFTYYPTIYQSVTENNFYENQYDVFFCAAAKNRLEMILDVYKRLKEFGLKLDFYITGVNKNNQKFADEIKYIDFMQYDEYLKHVQNATCLLEILQNPFHHGYTVRTSEALMYNKKLLSNNIKLLESPFYNSEKIFVFSSIEDINGEKILQATTCNYTNFLDLITFQSFCNFIKQKVSNY